MTRKPLDINFSINLVTGIMSNKSKSRNSIFSVLLYILIENLASPIILRL